MILQYQNRTVRIMSWGDDSVGEVFALQGGLGKKGKKGKGEKGKGMRKEGGRARNKGRRERLFRVQETLRRLLV